MSEETVPLPDLGDADIDGILGRYDRTEPGQARRIVVALVAEVDALRRGLKYLRCAYCGGHPVDRQAPDAYARMMAHQAACAKHPLHAALKERDRWQARAEAREARLGAWAPCVAAAIRLAGLSESSPLTWRLEAMAAVADAVRRIDAGERPAGPAAPAGRLARLESLARAAKAAVRGAGAVTLPEWDRLCAEVAALEAEDGR